MYGQTEATARMSYLPPQMVKTKQESIGIAIPGGKFSLRNKDKNGVGELFYGGENVYMGYAYSMIDLRADSNNNVLNTGDLARADEDGYYWRA